MTIRPATIDDADEVLAFIRALADYEKLSHEVECTADDIRKTIFGKTPAAYVDFVIDEASSTIAGFALWFPTFSTFLGKQGIWLEDLFVKPEFRGSGYGLELLQSLRARTNGRVEWNVLNWNEPSITFYRALGAEPVEGWTRFRWLPSPIAN
jgi:GNAT superfamily N-acetyltransferase